MKSIRLFKQLGIVLLLAIIVGFFAPQASSAQNGTDPFFFEETGHWVKDEFLVYFRKYGELEIFGYPLTEQFVDQGLLVQYFQKARMEWHPENPVPYKVQLGLLGDELKYRQPSVSEPTPRSRRKVFFPATGHTVSYAFLDFFNENGGIDIFGYPITEMYFEEGQIVQYFQRLKLQWQPNDPANAVVIDNLGEIYIGIYGDRMPSEALRSLNSIFVTPETAVPQISGLRAMVSLRYSVMTAKRNQTVTVLVTDTNGDYVENARVEISFIEMNTNKVLPNSTQTLLTDKRGFANASLPVNEGRSGTNIIVRVIVTYGELSTTAQNVFLLWW
ncbi:MAG: hypothetical protein JXR84_14535 [Anaerolineae bacterium]|nr:hypothetical protein [Anaerolineae bacterium]